jgi:hypothetical protein
MRITDGEGKELRDALSELLSARKGWHVHVNDAAYQWEVTVYREDDDTATDIANPS